MASEPTARARPARPPAKKPDSAGAQDVASPEALLSSLHLVQRDNATLRLLVAIYDRLSTLVLEGATAETLTPVFSQIAGRPVLLLSPTLQPVASKPIAHEEESAAWSPSEAYVTRVLQTMSAEHRALRLPPLPAWGVPVGCVLAPIVMNSATLGYLAILEPEGDSDVAGSSDVDLLAAEHAARVYALALMRERIATEVSTELRDELLEGLVLGQVQNDQAARERARQLGYDESLAYRALVFAPDDAFEPGPAGELAWAATRRSRMLESLSNFIRERAPRAITGVRHAELVALVPDGIEPGATELGKAVVLYVTSVYPDRPVTVGVGAPFHGPMEIARSYEQARRSAEVALRFGRRGQVMSFEELGLYRLLFQIGDRSELRAFLEQVLGSLIDYDRKHKTDLVHTLGTYLTHNNSLQATARELYVHVNTAAYRIQRIQAITGLDLARTDDCLMIRVALMILKDLDVGKEYRLGSETPV